MPIGTINRIEGDMFFVDREDRRIRNTGRAESRTLDVNSLKVGDRIEYVFERGRGGLVDIIRIEQKLEREADELFRNAIRETIEEFKSIEREAVRERNWSIANSAKKIREILENSA